MGTLSDKTVSGDFTTPNTTDDMDALETWEYGDKIEGSFAKSIGAFRRWREDIERAFGNESDYDSNVKYINLFRDTIGDQLKKLK